MIFFWLREAAGWGLVLVSLYLVRLGLIYVSDLQTPKIVEASILMIAGVGILRAGILLVRVSTASRIAARQSSSSR